MITLTEIIHIALGGVPFLVLAGPFLWKQLGDLRREQKEWKEELRQERKEEMREYKEELREARQRTDQIMALLMANAGLSYPAKKRDE